MLEMLSIFDNPSMLHAAVVHMPIALLMVGVPLLLLAGVLHRNNTLRVVAFLVYALAAGTSWYGVETGEKANRNVPADISAEISTIRDDHHDYAHLVMYASAVTAALVLISMLPLQEVRVLFMLLALVGAIGSAMLVAYTGHLGGRMVYEHGVGTPNFGHVPAASAPTATTPAAPAATPTPPVTPAPPATPPAPALVPIRDIDPLAAKQVSYLRDIKPIMEDRCIDCHEGDEADGEYDVSTVAMLLKAGAKAGAGVIPGDPDGSSIVKYIRGELQPRMPKKKAALSEDDLHTIRQWILAGAVDDSAPVDVIPEVSPLSPPAAAMPNTGALAPQESVVSPG